MTRPYYDDGTVQLYLGDCREVLTLFDVEPVAPTSERELTAGGWGVEVNEVKIFTYTGTTDPDRWILYRKRFDGTGRITVLSGLALAGELVHVAAGDRVDADELYDMFLDWGIHKSALKVSRIPARPLGGDQ
jgi:hypothetical protein